MRRLMFPLQAVMLLAMVLVLMVPADLVAAQRVTLNPDAVQTGYGDTALLAGFQPDPYRVPMLSGGRVDVAEAIGSVCRGTAAGYAASAPDFRLDYTAGMAPALLRFVFAANDDTTLVVYTPDGEWFCDDDTGPGASPLISFYPAATGTYNIWVGSLNRGQSVRGELLISGAAGSFEADVLAQGGSLLEPAKPAVANQIDIGLMPRVRTFALESGISADPYGLYLTTGGPVNVQRALQAVCQGEAAGFSGAAPDVRLYLRPQYGEAMRFLLASVGDTTLAINTPDGEWFCNDDWQEGASLNPMVILEPVKAGWYNIWAGSFYADHYVAAELHITTQPLTPEDFVTPPPAAATIPDAAYAPLLPHADPFFGAVTLAAGFSPDPHVLPLSSGGEVYAPAVLGTVCEGEAAGFIPAAPHYRINYTGSAWGILRVFFVSGGDTTMVIRGPDGRWLCSDDDGGGFDPLVAISAPAVGAYDVWVGSFYSGQTVPGILYVTMQSLDVDAFR